MKSAAELGHRWLAGSSRVVREALENPRTHSEYYWGLSFAAGNLRKLIRKAHGQAIITLSAALLREARLKGAEGVLVLPLPEGGLLLRRATDEDVTEAHLRYTAEPQPCFPVRPAPADLTEVEKLCPQCGLIFRTRRGRQVYCDACRHERDLTSHRASWRLKGKLTPSYRRKLKRVGLASASRTREDESLTLPFGETPSVGSTTQPAARSPLSAVAPCWPICVGSCPDSTQ
jgi:hypothetical protein